MTRWIWLVSFALHPLLAWSAPQVVTSGDYKAYIEDAPAWVKPVPGIVTPQAGTAEVATVELLDMQFSVRAKEVSLFKRIVLHVTNQAEVEEAAQIPIRYLPSFQKLTVHSVWVTRTRMFGVRSCLVHTHPLTSSSWFGHFESK